MPTPAAAPFPTVPLLTAAAAAALAFAAAPSSALAAPGVQVENAAARLVVIPENRSDVAVTVTRSNMDLPLPQIRREGDRMIVDGGLRGRVNGCGSVNINIFGALRHRPGEPNPGQRVNIRGVGLVPLDRLPVITARVPRDTSVSAGDAVWGEIGPSYRLRLAKAGCGDFRVGEVRGDFDLASTGSGDVGVARVGRVRAQLAGSGDLVGGDVGGDVDVNVAGSSDAKFGRIGGGLAVRVAGSGDLHAAELNGPFNVMIAGSGDVRVDGGRAPAMSARVSGSGDVRFGGEAGALSAETDGSGDIHVARVTGPVAKVAHGSGEIMIGR